MVDNEDPAKLGRLKLRVPSVLGGDVVTGWAMPCAPYGGAADQGFLFMPGRRRRGLGRSSRRATWSSRSGSARSGASPADSELPKPNKADDGTEETNVQDPPTRKIIKTAKGHTLQFEDADGSEMILIREGGKGHFITMDKNGITVTDANKNTIKMTSSGIKLTDATGNTIDMSSSAFTITAKVPFKIDAGGQTVTIVGSAIDLQQG